MRRYVALFIHLFVAVSTIWATGAGDKEHRGYEV